ncbi:hypothetical protein [Algiphilus sp.]|uniref:hypothetical protein n=1 Tax=Algiphilus sp. TaxID=1872431 RepID=UPI002A5F4BF3|nr:hypothetical protein [Pseudomonadota bacterium]
MSAKHSYVALMMNVISRGLVAASRSDEEIRREFSGFRPGYRFAMTVYPSGPGFVLRIADGGYLEPDAKSSQAPDLVIRFKHIEHAFLVLSFQEGTARAFANDRMVADGNVSDAIRLVRCLNRMEKLILPKLVATRAVKDYGKVPLVSKLLRGSRIYGRVAASFVTGK